MTIQLRRQPPDKDDFIALFNMTGWNKVYQADRDELERAIQNSWLVISAYDGERLVGFGRVVSDTVLYAMIHDMIVLPDHQGKGIGTLILKELVEQCRKQGIRDIQLFCAKGKRAFYEQNGFDARPADAPGMQLRKE